MHVRHKRGDQVSVNILGVHTKLTLFKPIVESRRWPRPKSSIYHGARRAPPKNGSDPAIKQVKRQVWPTTRPSVNWTNASARIRRPLELIALSDRQSHPVWTDSSGEKHVDETTELRLCWRSDEPGWNSGLGKLANLGPPTPSPPPKKGIVGK